MHTFAKGCLTPLMIQGERLSNANEALMYTFFKL